MNTDLVVQKLIVNEMTSENSFEPVQLSSDFLALDENAQLREQFVVKEGDEIGFGYTSFQALHIHRRNVSFIRQNERVEIPSIGGDAEIICNGESKIDDARAKLYLSHDGSNIPQDRNETQFELFSTHLKDFDNKPKSYIDGNSTCRKRLRVPIHI